MSAPRIHKQMAVERFRAAKRLRQQSRLRPTAVTIVQDESTKRVLAVAIDREAAERFRQRNGGAGELIDFILEV